MPAVITKTKTASEFLKYNMWWDNTVHPLQVEIECIRHGGQWRKKNGTMAGMGLYYHYRKGQELLWPEKRWHKWRELSLQMFLQHEYVGEMGCASAGKSDDAATDFLFDWYCFPECTTVLVASTTLQSLDTRVWGMIKRYHKIARSNVNWIPGHLIEGARRIVQDEKQEFKEGRDFRNGVIGIACKKGNTYVGMENWIGIHNKRVGVVGDEAQMMPRALIDSFSNLSKCEHFRARVLGNPNDTSNAHGFVCEPAAELGGWEGAIDQRPGTKTWKTRMPNGVCIQKPGGDSPNLEVPDGEPVPFPFLCTRKMMADEATLYGTDDWHYKMFVDAMMPRGQGSRRILTRQSCERNGALNEPIWRDSHRTKIGFLDAAYRGVGGDRCVFGELQFGTEAESEPGTTFLSNLIAQNAEVVGTRKIIALIDLLIVPISAERDAESPEEQICKFVKGECERRGIPPDHFYYDSGMRTSLVQTFSRIWSPAVESVDCGGKASEQMVSVEIQQRCCDYYSKFITELWYSMRLCVECKQFRGLTRDAMWEFCAREFKTVGNNKIEVETKEDMKKKSGRSPDLADSIAVGVWGARQRGFVISRIKPPKDDGEYEDDAWRRKLRQKAKEIWSSASLTYR